MTPNPVARTSPPLPASGSDSTGEKAMWNREDYQVIAEPVRFYSVAQAARLLGMSPVTLYRAISAGEFPAVRIRNRLIVPAKALDAMSEAAVTEQALVDAAHWTGVRQ
jgi:excisionase family DNA binding protein